MKIGIDALGIEKASGGRTSVVNLLRALFKVDSEIRYLVAVSSYEPLFDSPSGNVHQIILPFKNRFLRRIIGQLVMPFSMRDCDVVHFTKNLSVFGILPSQILTIHDLSMLKYPELMAKTDLIYWKTLQKISVRQASRIITVSENAAMDIYKFYGVPRDKIGVIYHGVSPAFKPCTENEILQVREKYNLPEEFIIHVGRIDPIKNLTSLVRAYYFLLKRNQYKGKLVIVGEFYKKTPDLELIPTIKELGLEDNVVLPGYAADEDLPAIYCASRIKVFPSHNEGFGLAPLEAMACGIPVVVHKAGGAVAEVVSDAGILTERNDPETLYEAMSKVLFDPALENKLRKMSLLQAQKFSWENAAMQTLDIYKEVIEEKSR